MYAPVRMALAFSLLFAGACNSAKFFAEEVLSAMLSSPHEDSELPRYYNEESGEWEEDYLSPESLSAGAPMPGCSTAEIPYPYNIDSSVCDGEDLCECIKRLEKQLDDEHEEREECRAKLPEERRRNNACRYTTNGGDLDPEEACACVEKELAKAAKKRTKR